MRTHGRRIEKGRKIHCSGQILLNAGRRQEHWLASDRGSVVAGPPPSRLRASLGAALKPDGGENPALSWFDPADSRQDEHTSEPQSLMRIPYAAFCFKKKIQSIIQ